MSLTQKPSVTVVEASAGSGKTYALAQQYLTLLLSPDFASQKIILRSILAITFTNKAMIEMKERILELLKKLALGQFSSVQEERNLLEKIGLKKEQAQQSASQIIEMIIAHYNFFQIQTIDSFVNALLSGCAFSIGRSASFRIRKDYAKELSYCLDLVIEEALVNKEIYNFFEEFLEHYLFVENRMSWFPKKDIIRLMHSFFTLGNRSGRFFKLSSGESATVIKLKKRIFSQIRDFLGSIPEGFNIREKNSIKTFVEESKDIFDISDLPGVFKKESMPFHKDKSPDSSLLRKWISLRAELVRLMELDSTVFYNPYIKLFALLSGFLETFSQREDVLFLEELNRTAQKLFDPGGISLAEIYYRLALRFRHYLIDEFQDTSILQWENFRVMVEEALATGGSLFYVGDKKQAIYRFRGGEVGLFDAVARQFSCFSVTRMSLTKNYRSQKTIVEFNNCIFAPENLERFLQEAQIQEELACLSGAQKEILDIFSDASQIPQEENSQGYVSVQHITESTHTERDQLIRSKITHLLSELSSRFHSRDIAFLCRDNNEVELVSSWLLEAGFSVESEKTLNITENFLVKEVVLFLKFLHSPVDDLSFAGFIRSSFFCQAAGVSENEIADFIFRSHACAMFPAQALYRLFRKNYSVIWENYIEEFFKKVGFISVYELVVSICWRFSITSIFPNEQAFLMGFLEIIQEKEDEYVDLGGFLDYLESLPVESKYLNGLVSDSIKVLTIHKSKGLEFPVVVIPFLRMEINPESTSHDAAAFIDEHVLAEFGLMRITKVHRAYSPLLQKIYAEAYKKACVDELNALYVALTRAQRELYIFIPPKSGRSNNKAIFLMPKEKLEYGTKVVYPDRKKSQAQTLCLVEPVVQYDWIHIVQGEFDSSDFFLRRNQIQQGILQHMLLAQLGDCAKGNLKFTIAAAVESVVQRYPWVDKAESNVFLERILHEENLHQFFYLSSGVVFCEKEVTDARGDLKRIDRLILLEQEVWIIDYKSSFQEEAARRKQIREYRTIIQAMYSGFLVRCFFVYLDSLTAEEFHG